MSVCEIIHQTFIRVRQFGLNIEFANSVQFQMMKGSLRVSIRSTTDRQKMAIRLMVVLVRLFSIGFLGSGTCFAENRSIFDNTIAPQVICRVGLSGDNFAGVGSSNYQKTRDEFLNECIFARISHPDIFEEPRVERSVFRIDLRSPSEVKRAGGFWPNPEKPPETVLGHTLNSSTGSSSYVSTSLSEESAIIRTLREFTVQQPKYIKVEGKLRKMTEELWANPKLLGYSKADLEKAEAVWVFFQYEASAIEGVRIVGGEFRKEKEVITRGISIHNVTRYREVLVTQNLVVESGDTSELRFWGPYLHSGSRRVIQKEEFLEWKAVEP